MTKKTTENPHFFEGAAFWSGILATSTMTLTLFELQKLLAMPQSKALPPARISHEAARPLEKKLATRRKLDLTLLSHFGYGTACALVYHKAQAKVKAPPLLKGTAYGVAVWAASYLGLLPVMGSRASAFKMKPSRNWQMFLAHLVWGATLGYAEEELSQRGPSNLVAS